MAIMKIRGGDLDLVEYEFKTFHPGTFIKTLGFEKKMYTLKPCKGTITVMAPARIHLTVLDTNRFAPDHPREAAVSGLQSSVIAQQKLNVPKPALRSIITGNRSSAIL